MICWYLDVRLIDSGILRAEYGKLNEWNDLGTTPVIMIDGDLPLSAIDV
jgi:hypothetical protein